MHLQNTPVSKALRTWWKRGRKFVRVRGLVCCEIVCPSNVRSCIKYQHACPNVSWERMAPTDMPKWTGAHEALTQITTGNWKFLGVGGIVFPREEFAQLVIQYQMVSPGNIHTSDIIQIEQVVSHGFLVTNFEVPSAPGPSVLTHETGQLSCFKSWGKLSVTYKILTKFITWNEPSYFTSCLTC